MNVLWSAHQQITLRDGRTLAVAQCGTPDGRPILYLHGTPGSRLNRYPFDEDLIRLGVRLITYDRPGYGQSTRHPGRTVADAAADVLAITLHLGLSAVPVFGHSGGGPHAIACAALLGHVITRAASVAGIAPFDARDRRRFDGLPELTIREFTVACDGRQALEDYLTPKAREIRDSLNDYMPNPPEVDREFLADPRVSTTMAAATRRAVQQAAAGWVDDDLAFLDWGFDPADVSVPCAIWHGALDPLVPANHATWLAARISGAELHLEHEFGHSSMQRKHPEIIQWLLKQGGR